MFRRAKFFSHLGKRRGIVIVAIHIAQQRVELGKAGGVEAAMLLNAVLRPCSELVECPARLGDANYRHMQFVLLCQCLQRGKDLFVGKVARRSKENQCVRYLGTHVGSS